MENNELANVNMNYEVNGQEINLTMNTVKNYLVRGNADKITSQEVIMFMNLCKYQKLNPFLNEAYLVKFGQDAQIITGKEAFMKRAENNPDYEGFEAGVFVTDKDNVLNRREGTFKLPDEKLVGGWAKVYRKDRKVPIVAEVSMEEYSKKQSTWNSIPSTMIRKVALVQALREAFPTDLGAMYTAEEVQERPQPVDVHAEVENEVKNKANAETIDFEVMGDEKPAPSETVENKKTENHNKKELTDKELDSFKNVPNEQTTFDSFDDMNPGY